MAAKENISVKFLIHLVGERPALWDKTSDDYKDRALKETSWREICTYINENYYSMAPRAKEEFTRMIMKKWTHIRDSWVKSMKYGYDEVTKKPPKPYVYHNELKFMQKILKCKPPRFNLNRSHVSNMHFEEFYREKNDTQNSTGTSHELENNEDEESGDTLHDVNIEIHKEEPNVSSNSESKINVVNKAEDLDDVDDWHLEDTQLTAMAAEQSSKETSRARKKRQSIFINSRGEDEYEDYKVAQPTEPSTVRLKVRPVENRRINQQRFHHSLYENRHWNFFKGILPSVNELDEDNALQFQAGVIVLLQKLRESQKQKLSQSLQKGRGRKRKSLSFYERDDDHDGDDVDYDDNNAATTSTRNPNTRRKSTRYTSDPIAPEDKNVETDYSSDN